MINHKTIVKKLIIIYITLQGCITFIISARKVIYNVKKNIYISNKCVFLTFYSSVNPKKLNVSWFTQKYEAARLYSTLIIIRNASWAVYYYDFWRSCDTEDWSNDAEIQLRITGINDSLTYFPMKNSCKNIPQFYCIFNRINATLVCRKRLEH